MQCVAESTQRALIRVPPQKMRIGGRALREKERPTYVERNGIHGIL